MAVLPALLLLVALAGLFPVGPHAVSPRLLFPVWFPSWIAQSFAQPLVVVALAVIAVETPRSLGWGAVALGGALGFVLLDHRNRVAGRLLLRSVGAQDRIPPLAGLFPLGRGARDVVRTSHAYGPGGERRRLDLIVARAPATNGLRPILIHVPGGAWVSGAKNQQAKPLLHHLARAGWLCVDVNYRLGPDHRFPAMIEDVLAAIAWVKANAAAHGGDLAFVALTGGSAGGHLTALAALAHDDPAFKPGFEAADARVDAAVPLYGRFDFLDRHWRLGKRRDHLLDGFMSEKVMPVRPDADPALWHAASPLDRLRHDAPPMLLTHGTGDTLLPAAEAAEFAEALGAVSDAAVRYVPLAGVQHAYDVFASALTWAHVRAVEHWLDGQRRAAGA